MPYIKQTERDLYDKDIEALVKVIKSGKTGRTIVGAMQFAFEKLLLLTYKPYLPNYTDYNEMMGVLSCAKREFIRLKKLDPNADGRYYVDSILKISLSLQNKILKIVEKLALSARTYTEKDCITPAGQLNYIITRTILLIAEEGDHLSIYVGVLKTVQDSIYYKPTAKYEDKKIKENGAVVV